MNLVLPLLCGTMFGVGLTLSGMTQPTKVIGFLDFAGEWDPTLAFVMGGAIAVHLPLRALIMKRHQPTHASNFPTPPAGGIDRSLLLGAVLFGAGWGLAGYCPGPVITSFLFSNDALVLMLAMAAGMGLFNLHSQSDMSS